MANDCFIKNKKNLSPDQTLDLIKKHFKDKFGLKVDATFDSKHSYFMINIKGLQFGFWNEKTRYSCYDTSSTIFDRTYEDHNEYHTLYTENRWISRSPIFVYDYLWYSIINLLAHHHETMIESDGAGPYKPYAESPKFESYMDWVNYFMKTERPPSLVKKVGQKISGKTLEAALAKEFTLFPELVSK